MYYDNDETKDFLKGNHQFGNIIHTKQRIAVAYKQIMNKERKRRKSRRGNIAKIINKNTKKKRVENVSFSCHIAFLFSLMCASIWH